MASLRNKLSAVAALAIVLLPLSAARPGTVERVSLADMLQASEIVFHGIVESSQAVRVGAADDIVTRVRFQVHDVIKGSATLRQVDLDFGGGELGGLVLSYSDMNVPSVGEEGVYFVESVSRRLLNPLYGWAQGHLLVRNGARGKQVHTYDLQPVYDLRPGLPVAPQISAGTAQGIVTAKTWLRRRPMTLIEFKARLRQMGGETQ